MDKITAYFGKACSTGGGGVKEKEKEHGGDHSYSGALSKGGEWVLKGGAGLKDAEISHERIFTRHFYNKGEVCSALTRALLTKNVEESAFWCLELIDSEEYDDVLEVLFKTYIQYMQPTASWLRAFIHQIGDFTTEGCLWLCIDFATLQSQISAATMGHNTPLTIDSDILHWFQSCSTDWFANISFTVEQYVQYMMQFGTTGVKKDPHISMDTYLPNLKAWALQTGRRVRRRWFSIPYDLRRTRSSLTELRRLELSHLMSCSYYNRIFEESKIGDTVAMKNVFSMDDLEEDVFQAIHAQIFPDDIPDEWSLADQMQSHGTGATK